MIRRSRKIKQSHATSPQTSTVDHIPVTPEQRAVRELERFNPIQIVQRAKEKTYWKKQAPATANASLSASSVAIVATDELLPGNWTLIHLGSMIVVL